jgi:thiol:disulfide interchange protein DsbC
LICIAVVRAFWRHRVPVYKRQIEPEAKNRMCAKSLAALTLISCLLFNAAVSAAALPEKYRFIQDEFPDVEITAIEPSPIPGILQMSVGSDLYYVSEDGKYFIAGDIFAMKTKENVTELARAKARGAYLASLDDDAGVNFAAADELYTVKIFTDVDCTYCRKLHREIAEYNKRGISVRYLLFPRQGPGTPSWAKSEAVWCAKSRQDALTKAKNGETPESEKCDATAIADSYKLGKSLGISGTPTIVTDDGQLLVGYHSPDELLGILQGDAKANAG